MITRSFSMPQRVLDWLGRYGRPRSSQLQEDLAILASRHRYLAASMWGLTDSEMVVLRQAMDKIPVPKPPDLVRVGLLLELEVEEHWDQGLAQEMGVRRKAFINKLRRRHCIDLWMLWCYLARGSGEEESDA